MNVMSNERVAFGDGSQCWLAKCNLGTGLEFHSDASLEAEGPTRFMRWTSAAYYYVQRLAVETYARSDWSEFAFVISAYLCTSAGFS